MRRAPYRTLDSLKKNREGCVGPDHHRQSGPAASLRQVCEAQTTWSRLLAMFSVIACNMIPNHRQKSIVKKQDGSTRPIVAVEATRLTFRAEKRPERPTPKLETGDRSRF